MPRPQYLTISPPLGGVVESTAYQSQPPYTCYSALNCWPKDSTYRDRITTRPGLSSYATGGTATAGTSAIRLLAEVNYATVAETTRYLIASSDGVLYKLSPDSASSSGWVAISSDLSISKSNPIQAAPFGNRLYIADWEATSVTNTGTDGVIGKLIQSGTAGEFTPILWGFSASGDGWTETTTTGEYDYDLSTHPVEALGVLLSGKRGVRFAGPGALSRTGVTLPPDGQSAVWQARLGPWNGDSRIIGGIGSGGTGVPGEYALVYDADTDAVSAYIGGTEVATGTVSTKTYCLFKIKLTNSGGTITADMTIDDLKPGGDGEVLSHSGDRAYTSSTLSSQVVSDQNLTAVFAEEVRYNRGSSPFTGTETMEFSDPTASSWSSATVGDVLAVTGRQDSAATGNAKSYVVTVVGDHSFVGTPAATAETGLRYHLLKDTTVGHVADTFVSPGTTDFKSSTASGSAALIHDNVLSVTSPTDWGPTFYDITSRNTGDSLTISLLNGDPIESKAGTTSAVWSLPRSAKILDLEDGTLARWEAKDGKNVVPHGSKMIITWQDRMVLANDQINPHVWYMSRNGDPNDFLYGSEDLGSPIAGTNFQAGLIGEPLTALIAHNKSCLLFGAEDSIWLMRGDPMQGGYIERLSDDIGVVGPFAHTKTDQDATYFISHVGLYMMPSGCGDVPTPVSRDKIPARGPVDWGSNDAHLAFDVVHNGLMLLYLETATHTFKSVWFDLKHGGFWPLSFSPKQHSRLFHYQPAAGRDGQKALGSLMFGGDSGEVSQLDGNSIGDYGSSTAVTSSVVVGPIKMSPSPAQSAMIREIQTVGEFSLASSGAVHAIIRVGPTAKYATIDFAEDKNEVALAPWTFSSVLTSVTENPRVSGHAMTLEIISTAGHTGWAFDEACLTIAPLGKAR